MTRVESVCCYRCILPSLTLQHLVQSNLDIPPLDTTPNNIYRKVLACSNFLLVSFHIFSHCDIPLNSIYRIYFPYRGLSVIRSEREQNSHCDLPFVVQLEEVGKMTYSLNYFTSRHIQVTSFTFTNLSVEVLPIQYVANTAYTYSTKYWPFKK